MNVVYRGGYECLCKISSIPRHKCWSLCETVFLDRDVQGSFSKTASTSLDGSVPFVRLTKIVATSWVAFISLEFFVATSSAISTKFPIVVVRFLATDRCDPTRIFYEISSCSLAFFVATLSVAFTKFLLIVARFLKTHRCVRTRYHCAPWHSRVWQNPSRQS